MQWNKGAYTQGTRNTAIEVFGNTVACFDTDIKIRVWCCAWEA